MHKFLPVFLALFLGSSSAIASDVMAKGMITADSQFDVPTTARKLETVLKAKGLTVFAHIDHSAGAQKAGLSLSPTILVIFGNPKVGTLLMKCAQSAALDLPQKALIWQDKTGKTHFSYNDPAYLKQRHHLKGCDKVLAKISTLLAKLAKAATSQ